VQAVQRWILARLRQRRFFELDELNQAIWELLDELNARAQTRWPLHPPQQGPSVRENRNPEPQLTPDTRRCAPTALECAGTVARVRPDQALE
jgi:hypothetical protein